MAAVAKGNNMKKKETGQNGFISIALSFALGLGIRIYLLGPLLGGYLDKRFHTEPWCFMGGVLLAIVLSFLLLYQQMPKD